MTLKQIKNMAASVRQRLLDLSRKENRPFEEITRLYAMERFLFRLGCSKYKDNLVLKGAMMFRVWQPKQNRTTMDIDLLGRMENDPETIEKCISEICVIVNGDDGITFDPTSVRGEEITKGAEFLGRRIRFTGYLERMRIPMQVDMGFGDSVIPDPEEVRVPCLLEQPSPLVMGYKKETAIAEKMHAMIQLGILNSRMKDFYDIWLLSREFDFDGSRLAQAIQGTFRKRELDIDEDITAFSRKFIDEKLPQWASFSKKLKWTNSPESFEEIIVQVKKFLSPFIAMLRTSVQPPYKWVAPGPWVE